MTHATDIRDQVLTLDAKGSDPDEIAAQLGIPVARVDRILDDQDAREGVPHPAARLASEPTVFKRPPRRKTPTRPKEPQVIKVGPEPECGTFRGYWRHRRAKTMCDACRLAFNAHEAERRRKLAARGRAK